ncbi:hypothetical protein DOQ73_23100 [Salmonella enterica subsp. enterica]|nr:hypothetical protein [Salmonella enterica subsp. enterica serovar Javiana]
MKRSVCHLLSVLLLYPLASTVLPTEDDQTFAIHNIASGKNLRPFQAGRQDGNRVILYDHHAWKCLTWSFKQVGPDRYQLTNYYTGKLLDTESAPAPGVSLAQHETDPENLAWDFEAQPDGSYAIHIADTDLYVTAESSITNAPITLSPFSNTNSQKWQLIPQKPWF